MFKKILSAVGKGGLIVGSRVLGGPLTSIAGVWLLASQIGQATNYQLPTTKGGWANLVGTAVTSVLLFGAEDPGKEKKANGQ